MTIDELVEAGYREEAEAWLWWLVRDVAGTPTRCRSCTELPVSGGCLNWSSIGCPVTKVAVPVRVGNAASLQFQLDVYGELMFAIDVARSQGIDAAGAIWDLQRLSSSTSNSTGTSLTRVFGS